MIPIAANIPLTLCSVVIRRFIDSYAGRLPLAVASSSVPTASTVALLSGALVCLYHQLRKGTLVKLGLGRGVSSMLRNSRHTIQRRLKNSSWFLRNLASCRRRCAEAVLKIAQPADDSLEQILAETGAVENDGLISGTTSLPIFNQRHCARNRRCVKHSKEPPVQNLYSNRSFDSNDYSEHDIRLVDVEEQEEKKKPKNVNENVQRRPITRNFRKSLLAKAGGDGRRLSPKKRKKIEDTPPAESEDCCIKKSSDYLSPLSLTPINKVRSSYGQSSSSNTTSRRHSDRLKKQNKIQKVTRRTRSGRVYVYRL